MNKEQQEFAQLLNRVRGELRAMTAEELAHLAEEGEKLMSANLTTKPSHVVRTYTQQVRDHTSAMRRLQDQYFAALKRAEAQYFDGVKRITDALTQTADGSGEQPPAAAPVEQQAS
jgi:hypothetical protein